MLTQGPDVLVFCSSCEPHIVVVNRPAAMQRGLLQSSPCACGPVPARQRAVLSGSTARTALGAHCGCRASAAPRTAFLGSKAAPGLQPLYSAPFRGSSAQRGSRRGPGIIRARGRDGPDIQDRVAGAVPYLVPLFDGLKYGAPSSFPSLP